MFTIAQIRALSSGYLMVKVSELLWMLSGAESKPVVEPVVTELIHELLFMTNCQPVLEKWLWFVFPFCSICERGVT